VSRAAGSSAWNVSQATAPNRAWGLAVEPFIPDQTGDQDSSDHDGDPDVRAHVNLFGAVFYVVLAGSLAYMMSERGGGLSTFQLVLIPVALLVPLANALNTVRQLHTLERRSLLTQPAASQLFRAAPTQLSAGYATVVLLLPVLS
jgi:hypothetical protein